MLSVTQANVQRVPAADGGAVSAAELVRRLLNREPNAQVLAFREYAPRVARIAHRSLGNRSDVEDVIQDVFLRVFLRVHTLREPEAFGSFVVSVSLHVIRWYLRRRRVRRIMQFVESVPETGVPSLNFDARRSLRRFYDLLNGLPREERLVLGLRNIEGMSLSEIAGRLGVSSSTAKRRLFKATERMSRQASREPALAAYSPKLLGNLD